MPPKASKGKGKGPKLKLPSKPIRGTTEEWVRLMTSRPSRRAYQFSELEPFLYMKPPEAAESQRPAATPPPLHPENVVHPPIRTETPRQPDLLEMVTQRAKEEHERTMAVYRRDTLGRFLGGKGAWV